MKKFLAALLIVLPIAFLTTTPATADSAVGTSFEVTKTATPDTVSPSGTVNFTISLKNIAIDGSTQTPQTVTDTLPDGFSFANDSKLTKLDGTQVTFTPSSVSGQVVTWTFDGDTTEAIPQYDNVVISFSTTAPEATGSYENTACLTTPEEVCTTATVTVQTSPVAGVIENIVLIAGVGAIAAIFGSLSLRKKRNFEEDVLSSRRI
jgi:fimbrial isopeptide formation D2 family protein